MNSGLNYIDNMGSEPFRSERDARRAAARAAVELLGPATQLHRTHVVVTGTTDKPKGIYGVISGDTKPGDTIDSDSLHYVEDVIALADYIATGATS